MQFPITIELRRSRLLSFLTVLLHALAGGCLWVLPWPEAARLLLPVVALSLAHALRPSRIVGLRLGERGELTLLFAGGDVLFGSVQADTAVFNRLIVLRVRDDENSGRLSSLVLLPDSMPAEQFRLLRL